MRFSHKLLGAAALTMASVAAFSTTAVMAQDGLDSGAEANFYDFDFSETGIDPFIITMLAGGGVDVGDLGLGDGCLGLVTSQPDVKIELDGNDPVRVFFASEGDTTLIIEQPDGSYLCNDDGDGYPLNPVVEIPSGDSGNYAIWVGTYGANSDILPGYLVITTGDSLPGALNIPWLAGGEGGSTPIDNPTPEPGGDATPRPLTDPDPTAQPAAFDPTGEPFFGTEDFAGGSESLVLDADSDNAIDALGQLETQGCRGYLRDVPDYAINYTGSGALLRFFFVSDEDGIDSTLIVQRPDGTYQCGDDSGGGNLNPIVDIANAPAGEYRVWVGNYALDEEVSGQLYVTGNEALTPANPGS